MKNFKFLIIAVIVLALLIGAYFLVTELTKEEPVVEEEAEEIVVSDDTLDTIVTIAYSNEKGDVNFSSITGEWTSPSAPGMPVDQSFVQTMADSFIKVTALRDITGQGDESAYGFDEPTLTLNVGTRGGNIRSYIVGSYNDMSSGYYMKFEDKIYIIDVTIVGACDHALFDAIPMGSLPVIEVENIISLTVNGTDGNKEAYSSVAVVSVENYKDAASYGFDGTENKVELTYTETSDITDEAGNVTSSVDTEKTYSFSYVTKDGISYIMLPDDGNIYVASGTEALTEVIEETAQ